MTQYGEEVISRAEHQESKQKYKALVITKDETHCKLRMEKNKIGKLWGKLKKDLEQTKETPAKNYYVFLLEGYLLLKVQAIQPGQPFEFTTISDFLKCFSEQKDNFMYFLSDIYMHSFLLEEQRNDNPSPFIRDVQFQDFISFYRNQIKWYKAYRIF